MAAVLAGLGPRAASASAGVSWSGTGWKQVRGPSPGSASNVLSAVTVVSSRRAWAVGDYSDSTTGIRARALIVRWTRTGWKQVRSPDPGSGFNTLSGVAATSATSAWAVGSYDNGPGTADRTLIVRWNGSSWERVRTRTRGVLAVATSVC